MPKSNGEIIQERFAPHQFYTTYNEYGYSDIEILIDGKYSGIWIDDWMWFENDESDLQFIIQEIEEYINKISHRDCHICVYAYSQGTNVWGEQRTPILSCRRHDNKKNCLFVSIEEFMCS